MTTKVSFHVQKQRVWMTEIPSFQSVVRYYGQLTTEWVSMSVCLCSSGQFRHLWKIAAFTIKKVLQLWQLLLIIHKNRTEPSQLHIVPTE